jgi:hypothetical protein
MSTDEITPKAGNQQAKFFAVEIVDSVYVERAIGAEHAVEMIARRREANIESTAFGDHNIIDRSKVKSSTDDGDLDLKKDNSTSRYNQTRDTIESRYDEKRDDVESGFGEWRDAESQSNGTMRCDTEDTRYTDTDEESRFMNSLDEGELSSHDDIRNFSYAQVSDERTPRSLLCDFDFQPDDLLVKMNPISVDEMESTSIDEVLSEIHSVASGTEKVALPEQEMTSPEYLCDENKLDSIEDGHEGIRHHTNGTSTLPFSTNDEKLQEDATGVSSQKPLGYIPVDEQQWTSAVAEVRHEEASVKRGECSVDVVRYLICDFDLQPDDLRVNMNPNSVNEMEFSSIDEALSEIHGVASGSKKITLPEQELTSPKNLGSEEELDSIADGHEGLRHHTNGTSTLPFSTDDEKLQQDATKLSSQKPLRYIPVEKQQWTSAVAESLRREKVASAKRGECSVDVVHDVVSDLCFVVSPREYAEIGGSKVPKLRVMTSNETTRTRRLDGLKEALSKRPFSPLSSRATVPSTRKSNFAEAICDLCFVGDSSKRLERLENTLLIETAIRGSEKNFKLRNEPNTNDDLSRDRPFDEEESLSHSVTRLVENRLKTNGNSFASSDLIDLSGNVSLVAVSSTLSLRHPVMAAAMMENKAFPVCGAWQISEINELSKDVRTLINRRTSSHNVKTSDPSAVETKDHHSLEENNMATHNKQPAKGVRVSPFLKRAMKRALGSPRRSYSAHKFGNHVAATDMECSVNDFIGDTIITDFHQSSASMKMGAVHSPSAKTDVSVPFDEVDINITEVFALRQNDDEAMVEKVESTIIDDGVEDGVSICLRQDEGSRNIFLDAWVATTCDATGNDNPSIEVQECGLMSLPDDTGAVKQPDEYIAKAVQSSLKKDCDNDIINDDKTTVTVLSNEVLLLQWIFKAIVANHGESGMPQKACFRFDVCHIGESLEAFVEWTLSINWRAEYETSSKNKEKVDKFDNEKDSGGSSDFIVENARTDGLALPTDKNEVRTFVFFDEALLEAVKVALEDEGFVFFDEALLEAVKVALEDEGDDGCDAMNKDLEMVELSEDTVRPETASAFLNALHSKCSDIDLASKSQAATFDVPSDLKGFEVDQRGTVWSVAEPDTCGLHTNDKTDNCYDDIEKAVSTDKLAIMLEDEGDDGCDAMNKDLEMVELSEDTVRPETASAFLNALHSKCSDIDLASKSQAATFDVPSDLKGFEVDQRGTVWSVAEPDTCGLHTNDKTDNSYDDIEKAVSTDKLAIMPDQQSIDSGDHHTEVQELHEDSQSQILPKKEDGDSTEPVLEAGTEPLARAEVEYANMALGHYEAPNCGCVSLLFS